MRCLKRDILSREDNLSHSCVEQIYRVIFSLILYIGAQWFNFSVIKYCHQVCRPQLIMQFGGTLLFYCEGRLPLRGVCRRKTAALRWFGRYSGRSEPPGAWRRRALPGRLAVLWINQGYHASPGILRKEDSRQISLALTRTFCHRPKRMLT